MSPDLYFALTLVVKMAITAAFVLAATMTAERAGPLIGGLVATLPIGAGPVYVFLALDHDAHFISKVRRSLAINAANVIFAVIYACWLRGVRSPSVWRPLCRVAGADGPITDHVEFAPALLLNIAVCAAMWVARPFRHTRMPRPPALVRLALRASMVAVLVGVVVTFSFRIGPYGSGNLAVFPIVLSIMIILHRRVGGPATAAVMANAVIGLVGFAFACIVLNLTAERLGSALAWLGAAVSVAGIC